MFIVWQSRSVWEIHRYDSFLSCRYQHRGHGQYNRYLPVLTSETSHVRRANLQSEVFPASLQLWWKQKAGSDFCKLPLRITEEVEEEATASLAAAGVDVAIATVLTILGDIFSEQRMRLAVFHDCFFFFFRVWLDTAVHCCSLRGSVAHLMLPPTGSLWQLLTGSTGGHNLIGPFLTEDRVFVQSHSKQFLNGPTT